MQTTMAFNKKYECSWMLAWRKVFAAGKPNSLIIFTLHIQKANM